MPNPCLSPSLSPSLPLSKNKLKKQPGGRGWRQLPVWELEDEVSELHAFERHSLSPYLSARSVNQSLEYLKNNNNKKSRSQCKT